MNWVRRIFTRKPRHQHDYAWKGYGGCGWSLYICQTCSEKEIDA